MTRKHFIAIAGAIRKSITSRVERESVARALIWSLHGERSAVRSLQGA